MAAPYRRYGHHDLPASHKPHTKGALLGSASRVECVPPCTYAASSSNEDEVAFCAEAACRIGVSFSSLPLVYPKGMDDEVVIQICEPSLMNRVSLRIYEGIVLVRVVCDGHG